MSLSKKKCQHANKYKKVMLETISNVLWYSESNVCNLGCKIAKDTIIRNINSFE